MDLISPKYKMTLLEELEKVLWKEFSSYRRVKQYIEEWREIYDDYGNANFYIAYKGATDDIDLSSTLGGISNDILLKMATDLGIETPDFIPSIAKIRNIFKVNYNTASRAFEKAVKECYDHPDNAVSLANSALESIIKHILCDNRFKELDKKKTLYALTQEILKEFSIFPGASMPTEISTIGSALLKASKGIEDLRSNCTTAHGKTEEDYIVEDPLYAVFIVNCVSTIGQFLISFYEKKYNLEEIPDEEITIEDVPF